MYQFVTQLESAHFTLSRRMRNNKLKWIKALKLKCDQDHVHRAFTGWRTDGKHEDRI